MKYLILSDSHGRRDLVRRAWQMHADADGVVFLGDGVADLSVLEEMCCPLYAVLGNCDSRLFSFLDGGEQISQEQWMHIGEYTVLLMHGHRHGVKQGTDVAAVYAAARGADLLLFGHTHIPMEAYLPASEEHRRKKPLYLFNPGSLGAPRDGRYSYGLIQICQGQLLCSHGNL